MTEVWKPVPDMCGVFASSKGRVMRPVNTYGKMKEGYFGYQNPNGYMAAAWRENGKSRKKAVHILVALAFHGRKPAQNSCVMHLNDVKCDNRPENLKWGTQKENVQQACLKPCRRLYLSTLRLGKTPWNKRKKNDRS